MERMAALAMYDWPEVAPANDAVWAFLVPFLTGRGIEAPPKLARHLSYVATWLSPNLLMAQTCGYPYASQLRDAVQLVAPQAMRPRVATGRIIAA